MNAPLFRRRFLARFFLFPFSFFLLFACVPAKWVAPLTRGEIESANYRARCPALTKDIPYVENGDEFQRLDVYGLPRNSLAPVVVFIHGGYFQTGSRTEYALLAATLAPLGIVTVLIDYRMYPQVRYPAFCEDAVAALNWVGAHIADYGGDPTRLFVAGHSAGGTIAADLVVNERFRRQLHFDIRHLRGAILMSGAYDFGPGNLLDVKILHEIMGDEANYQDSQPIHHVRVDAPPLLIVNGDRDTLTSEVQAARFAQAMRAAGADVRYAKLVGGDHYSVVIDMTPSVKGPVYTLFRDFVLATPQ
jgi:acetyl esterase/lipase